MPNFLQRFRFRPAPLQHFESPEHANYNNVSKIMCIIIEKNTDAVKATGMAAFLSASFSGRIRTPTMTLFPDLLVCFVSADATDIAIEPIEGGMPMEMSKRLFYLYTSF